MKFIQNFLYQEWAHYLELATTDTREKNRVKEVRERLSNNYD